ncbi:MAG: hypothetical protein L0323_00190 [Planctomycetes bacterium]|nr:hypothetical protein [Planctomycetota bacterium]
MSGGRARTLALALAGCLPALALYRPSTPPSFLGGPELAYFGLPDLRGPDHWQVRVRMNPAVEGPYWRPLEGVALLGLNKITGDRPGPLLVAKALLHGAVATLLGALALRLTGDPRFGLASAALFAVHPVATQGAAWLVSLNEQFVSLAILGSILLFLRGLATGSWPCRVGAPLACGAGLLFKEVAAVAPLLAIGAGLTARAGGQRRLLRAASPMLAVVAAYGFVRLLTRGAGPDVARSLAPVQSLGEAMADILVRPWVGFLLPIQPDALGPWPPIVRWIPAALLLGAGLVALLHRRPSGRLATFAAAVVPLAAVTAIGRLRAPTGEILFWRLYLPSAGLALLEAALLVPIGPVRGKALSAVAPSLAVLLLGISASANAGAWREARATFARFHGELRAARPPSLVEGRALLVLQSAPILVRGVRTGADDPLTCASAWSPPFDGSALLRGGAAAFPLRVLSLDGSRPLDAAELGRVYGAGLRWFAFRWDGARRRLEPVGQGRTG